MFCECQLERSVTLSPLYATYVCMYVCNCSNLHGECSVQKGAFQPCIILYDITLGQCWLSQNSFTADMTQKVPFQAVGVVGSLG